MRTRASRKSSVILSILSTLLASCAEQPPIERTSESNDAIIGGSVVPNPANVGHVQVGPSYPSTLYFISRGSGTLLENSVVLSAAHNLDGSNCPRLPGLQGNLAGGCRFRPESHAASLGNDTDPFIERRNISRISVHPRYIPIQLPADDTGVDIAVMRVGAPFTVQGSTFGHTTNISLFPAQTLLNATIPCFGYGRDSQNGGTGTLRQASLNVSNVVPGASLTLDNTNGAIFFTGDSGGPCLIGNNVAGVIRDVDGLNYPPTYGHAVSAEAFRLWADLAMASYADWNTDFDADGIPDALFLMPDPQTGNDTIVMLGSSLCQQAECGFTLGIPLSPAPQSACLVAGDFNGDGIDDPVGQIDGVPFYVAADPLNLGSFLPTSFTFLPYAYESFVTGDFNEDGLADLEARDASGFVDLYFGQQGVGLQPGLPVGAFPSFTGDDGLFTTVTGTGNSTVNFTKSQFFIEMPQNRMSFDVQVFDGNQIGAYDVGGEHTCFKLFANSNYDFTTGVLVATKSGAELADKKWSNIYSGPVHVAAQMLGGDFMYRLDVELVDGTCENPLPHTGPGVNSFSVRATGDVWAQGEKMSFIGWDTIGDHVPDSLGLFTANDTRYDGFWPFNVDKGSATVTVTFQEADADELDDGDDPAGMYGPGDIQAPGQAKGANSAIRYEVLDAGGAVLIDAQNPSGNFNAAGGPTEQDIEQRTIPAQLNPTQWNWYDVNAGNNFQIWLPIADLPGAAAPQPATLAQFRLSMKPLPPLHWSTARTRTYWIDHPTDIESLLPIALGTGSRTVNVTVVDAARLILMQSSPTFGGNDGTHVAVCHSSPGGGTKQKTLVVGSSALSNHLAHGDTIAPTQALAALASELLATKLNIAGAAPGEDLAAAYIYGTIVTVGDTVAQADALVVGLQDVCDMNATNMVADVAKLTRYLRAANQAEVTNVAPRNISAFRTPNAPASALPVVPETPL